ncbi:MAG: TolC family protein, partial [Spirochaetales bacterium]|nr:TolC family protein [Spirochaetales bacterium]
NDLEAELLVQKLRLQVSTLYINLLMYREILKIEEQSLKILQEQSAIAHTEYEIGSLRASDLIDIRINSTEYAMYIDETRIRIFESRYALANLMDLPVEELPPLNSVLNPDYRGIYPALLKSDSSLISLLTAEALGRSTELKSLEKQEIDLRQGLRESRTGWLPAVEAVGDLKFAGRDFPLNEPSFSLGLNLSFDTPLFPGTLSVNTGRSGRDERNRQLSADAGVLENPESLINPGIIRNRIQTMEMDIRMKRRELEYRTEILADRILQTARQCELEREKCLLEEEKLKVEEIQMSMGEITRLDYVESEIRLADSRRSLFESIAALFNAELELEYLCGRESGLYSEILLKNADNSSPGGEP